MGHSQAVRQRVLIPSFGGSNPSAPAVRFNSFCVSVKKHKKVVLFVSSLSFVVCLSMGLLFREFGRTPSKAEVKQFEKLPYFKDGRFFNPYKSIEEFKIPSKDEDNSVNWTYKQLFEVFFNSSKYKPKHKVEVINLTRDSFGKVPDYWASLYWLGHATVIMELNQKRIIVDPVFGNTAPVPFIIKRMVKPPIRRSQLPHMDYVVITHNHMDHLERKTIRKLRYAHFIVPLGVGAALRGWGVRKDHITELGWGDKFVADGIIFNAEPAMHFSQRSLWDFNKTLWNSYVLQSIYNHNKYNSKIFIAGDGGFGTHIDEIARKYGKFDLVAIEIDAWNVRWPYVHMFPREVIEVAKRLQTKYILPVHYGTYPLGAHKYDISMNMLLDEVKRHKMEGKLLTPKMGEKVVL